MCGTVCQIGRSLSALIIAVVMIALPTFANPPETGIREQALEGRRRLEAGDLSGSWDALVRASEGLASQSGAHPDLADHIATSLYNLGVRFNNAGNADLAITSFIRLLHLDGHAPRVAEPVFRGQVIDAVLEIAGWLASAGQPGRAAEACRVITEIAPGDPRGFLVLGLAALAAGEFASAQSAFGQAKDLSPALAGAWEGEGRTLLARAARLTDAGAHSPSSVVELESLLVQGVRSFETAAELSGGSEAIRRDLARTLSRLSRLRRRQGLVGDSVTLASQSERELRSAIGDFPDSPWARMDLAASLFARRRYADAMDLYRDARLILEPLLASRAADQNRESWREAVTSCRQNEAAASYNLALDALNRAAYEEAQERIARACPDPANQSLCQRFMAIASANREQFQNAVASLEMALARKPESAAARLELGDLLVRVGRWDEARRHYERLAREGDSGIEIRDRLASLDPATHEEVKLTPIHLPGGIVTLGHYRKEIDKSLTVAVQASWLRVQTALGEDSLTGPLTVIVYPSQRAFRERSGPRIGSTVRGHYGDGQISVFEAPSHGTVTWVSVLTHEMTHHAVEKLSGGSIPRWLGEGIARWVEGDSVILDRDRVRGRIRAPGIPILALIDGMAEQAWNDPVVQQDWRDAALLAVEEIARSSGTAALLKALGHLKEAAPDDLDAALARGLGRSLAEIDAAWRGALGPAIGP